MQELAATAQRQYIDSVAVFTAHEEAIAEAAQVRGGMYWKNTGYLIRTSATGGEKSLGPRSAETERIYARFVERKGSATSRLAGLKQKLDECRRLNRALHVGRLETIVVRLLNELAAANLAGHFRVVGTHALYAYEAQAGIRFDSDALATRDIDLLWDVAKRVRFATLLSRVDTSMLNLLKKVDKSFRRRNSQLYTAVNQDGFEVDIIRREPVDGDPHPMRISADEDDFWVARATNAHLLLDAPPFTAVVVASNGEMARMNTLHPLAFAKFKSWMAQLPGRDPMKKRRDLLQAQAVEEAVHEYLPQLAGGYVSPDIPPPQGLAELATDVPGST